MRVSNQGNIDTGRDAVGTDWPIHRRIRTRLGFMPGDPRREQILLPAFEATDLYVIERCKSAEELVERARANRATAVLAAGDLLRANGGRTLDELRRMRVPLTLLVSDPESARWDHVAGTVVEHDAPPSDVIAAVEAAGRGERRIPSELRSRTSPGPTAPEMSQTAGEGTELASGEATIVAVASGAGSPGRTTVALNLGAGLGLVADTVVVDADLFGSSVAWHVNANPSRNLYLLTTAIDGRRAPETSHEWERALGQEVQPLDPRCPHGRVLCGIPKPSLRGAITPQFFKRVIAELGRRYRYIVIDVGVNLQGEGGALHRAALGLADHVLLVGAPTIPGLKRLELALRECTENLKLDPVRLAIALNGYDRRRHHSLKEIAWTFQVPIAVVIPPDSDRFERAIDAQTPAIFTPRRRFPHFPRRPDAARALLELADLVHGNAVPRGVPGRPMAQERRHGRTLAGDPKNGRPDRKTAPTGRGASRPPALGDATTSTRGWWGRMLPWMRQRPVGTRRHRSKDRGGRARAAAGVRKVRGGER